MAETESLIAEKSGHEEENLNRSLLMYGAKEGENLTTSTPVNPSGKDDKKTNKNEKPPKAFRSNRYATKKTAGQGLMGVSLLTSNTSHLKTTLDKGPHADYFFVIISMLAISICLQLIVGVLLLLIGSRESKLGTEAGKGTKKTEKLNDVSTLLMFLVTMLNAGLGAFTLNSVTPPVPPPYAPSTTTSASVIHYNNITTTHS